MKNTFIVVCVCRVFLTPNKTMPVLRFQANRHTIVSPLSTCYVQPITALPSYQNRTVATASTVTLEF